MKKTLVLFILLTTFSCGKQTKNSRHKTSDDAYLDSDYYSLMNEHRVNLGLPPLISSGVIEEVAKEHSSWMSTGQGRFGHEGWEGRCKRLRKELRGIRCGEIVAQGQKGSQNVFASWLGSVPHRRSLESPEWTHTGLGWARSSDGELYWTQLFLKIE
jgi:uncharacterized protein YkwD